MNSTFTDRAPSKNNERQGGKEMGKEGKGEEGKRGEGRGREKEKKLASILPPAYIYLGYPN